MTCILNFQNRILNFCKKKKKKITEKQKKKKGKRKDMEAGHFHISKMCT